jgi:hypothetical protein
LAMMPRVNGGSSSGHGPAWSCTRNGSSFDDRKRERRPPRASDNPSSQPAVKTRHRQRTRRKRIRYTFVTRDAGGEKKRGRRPAPACDGGTEPGGGGRRCSPKSLPNEVLTGVSALNGFDSAHEHRTS